MNPNVTIKRKVKTAPVKNSKTEVYYPTEEPKKMGETDYQHIQILILEQMLRIFLKDKKDVYLASDLIVYYEEGHPNRRFAPDLMICFGVENKMRRTYKLWEEKVVPQIVIEVVSKETWEKVVTTKRRLYERLGVKEYYVIDPEYKYLPTPLLAYCLEFGELVRQAVNNKRVFSSLLGLELVDTGQDFRLFNPNTGQFLPTAQDLLQINEDILGENEKLIEEIMRLKELKK
jgi:Uma2 family endonuclease